MENQERGNAASVPISSRKRKHIPTMQKSLAIMLLSMQGQNIVVELKNDTEITGYLEEADHGMNLTLHQAHHLFANGRERLMEIVFIHGSRIRYVHFSPQINAIKHLNDYVSSVSSVYFMMI